jgi:4,5-dihydroxyphthalate decarboxylase
MAMRLRTLLGDHACTAALKNGSIRSDLVEFDFVDYTPTNKGFRPMVREGAFDVSEMAIVTYLMAKNFNKPMVLLPDVVMARFQHGYAFYNAKRGVLTPADLAGKRVGIRSFTTTTGAWLRGILANDYGVDLNAIDWITFEEAHVAEFVDTTRRAPAGKQIVQMLLDGELDAILGEKVEHPDLNHMVVVAQELSDRHPDVVREVHRMLSEAASAANARFQTAEMRRSLECITGYTAQQGLIARRFAVDELFDNVTRPLIGEVH